MKMTFIRARFYCCVLIVLICQSLGFAQDVVHPGHYGLPTDATSRFIISHSQIADADFEQQALTEPRILYNWVQHHNYRGIQADNVTGEGLPFRPPIRHARRFRSSIAVDWHFPLGSGTVPKGFAPVKFGFNINQAPSCGGDYVVYALNVAGSSTQPNLIGLNNLYVNAGGTGFCSGTAPSVSFAYNVTSSGGTGTLLGSPSISLDGTKIAYIESVSSGTVPCTAPCSVFHVLTLGTTGSNGSFSSNTYTAAVPGTGNNASLTSLVFSNHTDTRSFAFVDYMHDVAYFGDDNGNIYKTTCVFASSCTPALATGYSQGTGIVVASGKILTVPIIDISANKLFVGASDGNLYIVNLANCSGTPVTCTGTVNRQVGNASGAAACSTVSGYAGLIDPPVIDITFQVWYAVSACVGATGDGAMVEGDYSANLAGPGITMKGGTYNLHPGMPDDNYYNNNAVGSTSVAGFLYFPGPNASKQLIVYGAPMAPKNGAGTALSTSNPPIVSGTVNNISVPGNGPSEPSAVTVIQNGNSDWLFFGQVNVPKNSCNNSNVAGEGCVFSYNLFNGSGVSTIPTTNTALASEASGASYIVVDNVSASVGASSIYFANQATTSPNATTPTCTIGASTPSYCAVKLTQSLLQ